MATGQDVVLEALAAWLPERRWFPARLTGVPLAVVDRLDLADPEGEARAEVLLVGAAADPRPPFVQVALTYRAPGTVPAGLAPVARVDGADVLDGPSDPAFVRAWLAAASGDAALAASLDVSSARAVSGEQSNSSIIVRGADGGPGGILKVFRGVWPGENPDVLVPAALAATGWPHVPAPLAWLAHEADGETYHLGVLSRFVPGAQDGFELACAMAERGEPFDDLGDALGIVIAELHEHLASALPVEPARPVTAAELTGHLHERLAWSAAQAPELGRWRAAVTELITRLGELAELPRLQRV
ncbi:MAG: aminoglycoside phosphotransferase, partial [Actinomycetales bacterium]|nr:aminoglycoside phosphotransferase [Actinomycetales bacterium]